MVLMTTLGAQNGIAWRKLGLNISGEHILTGLWIDVGSNLEKLSNQRKSGNMEWTIAGIYKLLHFRYFF